MKLKIMKQYMAGLQPYRGTASDPLLEEALQLEQDIITERCRERIS